MLLGLVLLILAFVFRNNPRTNRWVRTTKIIVLNSRREHFLRRSLIRGLNASGGWILLSVLANNVSRFVFFKTNVWPSKNADKFFNDPMAKDPQTGQSTMPPPPPPVNMGARPVPSGKARKTP